MKRSILTIALGAMCCVGTQAQAFRTCVCLEIVLDDFRLRLDDPLHISLQEIGFELIDIYKSFLASR